MSTVVDRRTETAGGLYPRMDAEAVSDVLKDFGSHLDSLLPAKADMDSRILDITDDIGNNITIARTTPSTSIGFAYIVRCEYAAGKDTSVYSRTLRWNPIAPEKRSEQKVIEKDAGGLYERIGFEEPDLEEIARYLMVFPSTENREA